MLQAVVQKADAGATFSVPRSFFFSPSSHNPLSSAVVSPSSNNPQSSSSAFSNTSKTYFGLVLSLFFLEGGGGRGFLLWQVLSVNIHCFQTGPCQPNNHIMAQTKHPLSRGSLEEIRYMPFSLTSPLCHISNLHANTAFHHTMLKNSRGKEPLT